MQIQEIETGYLVRLDIGEKVNASIAKLAEKHAIPSAFLSGLGAMKNAELGFYHLHKKDYQRQWFKEDYELVSLTGNITWCDGKPMVHTHVALGDTEFRVYGGHLFEGEVAVVVELLIAKFNTRIHKKFEPEIGLNLLSLCPVQP